MRKTVITLFLAAICQMASAQLNLEVTVHLEEAGTLFVKVQEQIEELGELSDIAKLTVTGPVNRDDFNVIRNQMTNLTDLDVSGVDAACGKFVDMERHKMIQRCILPTEATVLCGSGFQECPNLEAVVLPEKLKTVTNHVFFGCTKLTSVAIPDSVVTIESRAFMKAGLTSITIPEGVREIKDDAFQDCTALTEINLLSKNLMLRSNVFRNTAIETYTLPEGVTIDGDAAFGDCPNLKSFYFPDGLTTEKEVGTSTLWSCKALEEVRLPKDLTILPKYFFSNTRIPGIDLPPTVTEIGKYAYEGVETFTKAVIPDHVKKVGEFVFYESKIEEVVWSKNCHIIPNDAFRACQSLKRVTIPETVDSIQDNAFYYCTALDSIHLPEGIRYLRGTFNRCTSLRVVNIPSTVTYIGRGVEGCFNRCPLTHVDIPDGVTFIGFGSFSGVPIEEIKLPSKLKRIDSYAFDGTKLKSVVVPEGVTSIGERVFYSDSLVLLDLPSTLLTLEGLPMGDERWKDSEATLICRALVPPYVKGSVFFEGTRHRKLYVPAPSVETYKAHGDFKVANEILPLEGDISSGLLTVITQLTVTPESGLQTGKYDVKLLDTWGNYDLTAYTDHHPRLLIEEGSQFHMGTLSMDMKADQVFWFTNYKWQTCLNKGTTTADVIDVNFRMTKEHFFTPAFDTRLSDLVPDYPNTPYAFYRYDSGARAAGNFASTWVRMTNDETLRAGQGYAFKGSETPIINGKGKPTREYTGLHHIWRAGQEGTSYFLTTDNITLPLNHYNGEFAHNRNWNFIGMPYPAFLDIRGVDYDGPLYIYDTYNKKWLAVSALDDERVLEPMGAIFVQAPDEVNDITFLANRRQLSAVFVKGEGASSLRAMRRAAKNSKRTVYNLSLGSTDNPDNPEELATTRFVINPTATTSYEIGRDLSVMNMSDEASAQLYTLGRGVAYAINERPLDDGIIALGMQLPKDGTYTLTLALKQGQTAAGELYLIDNEEQTRTLISDGESYTFTATAGTCNTRFVLAFGDADPTSINLLEDTTTRPINGQIYNLQGQPVGVPQKGVYIQGGKKVVIK